MILNADARRIPLADKSVHCVITSPPYYGLRDYGTAKWEGGDPNCDHLETNDMRDPRYTKQTSNAGTSKLGYKTICAKCGAIRIDKQLGLEQTPDEYIANMVEVFREVWRVLRDDGTLWLNIGDSYAGSGRGTGDYREIDGLGMKPRTSYTGQVRDTSGLKPKDLIMIPARLALALQADGWYVRSDIIWSKANPMPESVTDRPTRSHEYVFLLTKSAKYYYDQEAVREEYAPASLPRALRGLSEHNKWSNGEPGSTAHSISKSRPNKRKEWEAEHGGGGKGFDGHSGYVDANGRLLINPNGRNKRSVWTIATQPTPFAHFATFPEKLVEPCILAGTSERGCCPKCGAPYVRVVERSGDSSDGGKEYDAGRPDRMIMRGAGFHQPVKITTIGWRPSCECDAGEPIPCTVFDPFSGSGTVERVAIRLGRRSVGCELNYRYIAEIATRRTSQIQVRLPMEAG